METCEIKDCDRPSLLTYCDRRICYEHWTDICNDKVKPEEDVWKE